MADLSVVGSRGPRLDAAAKATGAAKFAADHHLRGMLEGSILRSPAAHARVLRLDTSRALALPGVRAAITAAAVSTLNASGVYRSDELERGLEYLRKAMAKQKDNRLGAAENYYFYGNFYAAQAMFQAGNPDWSTWFRDAQADLIDKARRDKGGRYYWEAPRTFGDAYATASACLILEIPLRYLPIFER